MNEVGTKILHWYSEAVRWRRPCQPRADAAAAQRRAAAETAAILRTALLLPRFRRKCSRTGSRTEETRRDVR